MAKKKVLVTGVAGALAALLVPELAKKYEVDGIDKRPISGMNAAPSPEGLGKRTVGDVRDLLAVEEAFRGYDAVIDFANDPLFRQSWATSQENIASTFGGLLAAQRAGVKRYIFTSSNHVMGKYEQEPPYTAIARGEYACLDPATLPRISAAWPHRPDSPFGIAKAASEVAARYFAETYGMSNICLRLGTSLSGDQPTSIRQFHSILSKRDLVHLYECAIEAPLTLTFGAFFGVSNNTWRIWDISDTQELIGFKPQDDTERYRGLPFPAAAAE